MKLPTKILSKILQGCRPANIKELNYVHARDSPLLLNVFGKHAEHCAAKSVDGWQITVPIKMLVNCEKNRRKNEIKINFL